MHWLHLIDRRSQACAGSGYSFGIVFFGRFVGVSCIRNLFVCGVVQFCRRLNPVCWMVGGFTLVGPGSVELRSHQRSLSCKVGLDVAVLFLC